MDRTGVFCRKASLSDHSELTDISNSVFDGLGYLSAFYPLFMEQDFRHCFVAEKDGKVISYVQFAVVDGGRTGVRQIARTAEAHKGKGYYKTLENYSIMQVRLHCPELEQWAYTAYWNTFEKKRLSNPELDYQLIDKRYWRMYVREDTNTSVHAGKCTGQHHVEEITIDKAVKILEDPVNKKRLVPSGSLCSSWEPFSIEDGLRSNMSVIYTRSRVLLSSSDVGNCSAISTGTVYDCPKGRVCNLDYYGQDFYDLKAHILSHVKHAFEESNMNKRWYLCIFFPMNMSLVHLDEFMLKGLEWKAKPTDEEPVFVTITKRI